MPVLDAMSVFGGVAIVLDLRVAGLHTSGTLGGEVAAQNRAAGATPTLRVGDRGARGEPCGFARACNVWGSVLGL